jgi:hypothetical protein
VRLLIAILLISLAGVRFESDQPDALARARQLYNAQKYADAVEAATAARRIPALADAAAVVLARALLERSRPTPDAADLASAREALKQVDVARLTPRDHVEFVVGLGESVYFDDQYSAAAELFDTALARADLLDVTARDRLFEWWAGALDRQAQFAPQSERKPLYVRVLQRAEQELARDDRSAVACYWLVAAALGTDDLERAWGAAVSGWVRAPLTGGRGAALRDDLDQLVKQVIIPERAQRLSSAGDPRPTMAILQGQWDELKTKWGK